MKFIIGSLIIICFLILTNKIDYLFSNDDNFIDCVNCAHSAGSTNYGLCNECCNGSNYEETRGDRNDTN